MTTHQARTTIDAPTDQVWAAIADFGGVWRYNPSVEKSFSLTEANAGRGAERHCDLTLGGASVEERITDWTDGQGYELEIFSGTKLPPIRNMKARFDVRSTGATTVASGTMSYDTKFGPIGWLLDRLVVRKQFGKAWAGIFAGLKHHIETGEIVAKGTKLDYRPVDHVAA